MLQIFGIISGILSVFCYFPYIKDTLAKKTKPERATWFIWTVLTSIAFFSQMAKGATNSLWLSGVETLGVAVVFLLSIKLGMGGLAKRDIVALTFACIGLILWSITKEAAVALILVIIVDASGSVLTILKGYDNPETETVSTFILSGTAGLLSALAVGKWDIILLSYPVYILIINYLIAGSVIAGRRKHESK